MKIMSQTGLGDRLLGIKYKVLYHPQSHCNYPHNLSFIQYRLQFSLNIQNLESFTTESITVITSDHILSYFEFQLLVPWLQLRSMVGGGEERRVLTRPMSLRYTEPVTRPSLPRPGLKLVKTLSPLRPCWPGLSCATLYTVMVWCGVVWCGVVWCGVVCMYSVLVRE